MSWSECCVCSMAFYAACQLQMSAPTVKISELLLSMQSCICDVKAWATENENE